MSVLIKDMEMPKDCYECRFCSGYMTGQARILGYMCLASLKKENSVRGRRKLEELCTESIPDWCPLIELSEEHSRLIDGDELVTAFFPVCDSNMNVKIVPVRAAISHMHTVIETEGEG